MSNAQNHQSCFFARLSEAFGFPIEPIERLTHWGTVAQNMWRVGIPGGEGHLKPFIDPTMHAVRAGLYLYERGFKQTPRVIRTRDGHPAPRLDDRFYLLTEWVSEARPYHNGPDAQNLVEAARVLAGFHVAIRGFQKWSSEHSVANWLGQWDRTLNLTEQLFQALKREQRPHIAERLQAGLAMYRPLLEKSKSRAEAAIERYRAVFQIERARAAQRHFDFRGGNLLLGSMGVMLVDLEEVEPGLRIAKDVAGLVRAFGASDEEVARALRAYHEVAPLSADEVALLPIVNDPIHLWRHLLGGYLDGQESEIYRGEWTESIITTYYDWSVAVPYERYRQLEAAMHTLNDLVA